MQVVGERGRGTESGQARRPGTRSGDADTQINPNGEFGPGRNFPGPPTYGPVIIIRKSAEVGWALRNTRLDRVLRLEGDRALAEGDGIFQGIFQGHFRAFRPGGLP